MILLKISKKKNEKLGDANNLCTCLNIQDLQKCLNMYKIWQTKLKNIKQNVKKCKKSQRYKGDTVKNI